MSGALKVAHPLDLRLATHYGGVVVALAMGYSGEPGRQLGAWEVSADGITVMDISA